MCQNGTDGILTARAPPAEGRDKWLRFSHFIYRREYRRGGAVLADTFTAMIILSTRRKTVWGLKWPIAFGTLVILGFSPNAIAAGRHSHSAPMTKPATPNSNVRAYRLDKELTFRAAHHDASKKT